MYPAVYVSDTFVRTSVANKTLSYDVSVRNTSGSSRSVTLTGSLSSSNGTAFSCPELPSRTVTVAAHSTGTVTVGPVAWNLDSTSYWWPNVPYRSGYQAQLHRLTVHAVADDGHTSDATYRFGFREATQNGDYYYLNGVRVNFRGDNLQGADYDRINNGGKGDAYDTLPGFLPRRPATAAGRRRWTTTSGSNYNVVRIHQEPGEPVHVGCRRRDGPDDHRRDRDSRLQCRRRTGSPGTTTWSTTPVRWSCATATTPRSSAGVRTTSRTRAARIPNSSRRTCTRRSTAPTAPGRSLSRWASAGLVNGYPGMTYANFAVIPHYVDGFGRYGEGLITVNGRPDGEGEYIWPACNTKQGFEWFATATLAKRGKNATDLRPYTLLSAWASVVPGVRSTDFTPEEGGHPIYGADNLPDPLEQPADPARAGGVQPGGRGRPAVLVRPPATRTPTAPSSLPQAVPSYARNATVTRNITVLQRRLHRHLGGLHLDGAARRAGPARSSRPASTTLTVPLGSRVTQPVSFTAPATGSRVYLQLSTTKSGSHVFTDAIEYFNLGGSGGDRARTRHLPHRQPQQRQAASPSPATPPPTAPRWSSRAAPPRGPSATTSDGSYTLQLRPERKGARRQRRQQHGRAATAAVDVSPQWLDVDSSVRSVYYEQD